MLVVVGLPAAMWAPVASAAPKATSVEPQRLFEQSKPAVELIEVDFKAVVAAPEPQLDPTAMNDLEAQLTQKVVSGAMASDQATIFEAIVDGIAADPLRFIVPGSNVRTVEAGFSATGSGFTVSPDGYVVTNAHVAAPKDDEIKAQLASQGLQDLLKSDAQDIAKGSGDVQFTQAQIDKLMNADAQFYARYLQVAKLDKQIFANFGVVLPGVATGSKGVPAEVVAAGEEIPGKDVAILKLEGSTNRPTIAIGDDTTLNTGDKLFVIGFPGAATFHPLLSEASQIEPTLTSGLLSAKKTVNAGFTVLQTDAAITHGNSGGPVLDSAGKVVGIATFGSIDPNTGQEIAGLNFVVPMSVVKEFLSRANVRPSQSLTTQKYLLALGEYDAQHYKKALALFQEVNSLYPGQPEVQKYISDSQTAISQGKDKGSGGGSLPLAALAGVVLLLVVGLGGGTVFVVRRRKGGAPVAPGWQTQVTPTAPPMGTTPPESGERPTALWPMMPTVPMPTVPMPTAPAAPVPTAPAVAPAAVAPPNSAGAPKPKPVPTAVIERETPHLYCANCGVEHGPDDHFCKACGTHF